jgi:thymidine phosphorylase
VAAQGGEPAVWEDPSLLPEATLVEPVPSPAEGWVAGVDAVRVGEAARWLGAGRLSPGQLVDPAVGVSVHARVGSRLAAGEPAFTVHARDAFLAERAQTMLAGALTLTDRPVPGSELILARG